jgi:hypothetical protein
MVSIVSRYSAVIEVEMNSSGGSHWNFVTYGWWVVPMKIARFVISVNIQLSVEGEGMISFLVILVAFNMGKEGMVVEMGQ